MGHIQASIAAILLGVTILQPAVAAGGPLPTCFGRRATVIGTHGADILRGTHRADVIVGRGGNDRIFSYDGKDRICAGGGNDWIAAGYGLDLISGGSGGDELDAGPGSDLATGDRGRDVVEGGPAEHGDSDTLVGGSGKDALTLSPGSTDNFIFGGRGADQMVGHGRTIFYPGADSDRDWVSGDHNGAADVVSYRFHPQGVAVDLAATQATATDDFYAVEAIEGSMYDDVLSGDEQPNRFFGLDGSDRISSLSGDDHVDGGAGDDVLDGGESTGDRDAVSFDDAATGVIVSLRSARAEGAGDDTVVGFEDLLGSAYDDVLEGDDEPNWIGGGRGGVDQLFGLAGDDTLNQPGRGSDAGDGSDTCWDGHAANCEYFGHADPLPASRVLFPDQAQIYGPRDVNRVETQATGGLGPEVQDVKSSLVRITEAGCRSWRQRSESFVPRPCGAPVWNNRIRIAEALRSGFYEASSLAIYGKSQLPRQSTPVEFRIARY